MFWPVNGDRLSVEQNRSNNDLKKEVNPVWVYVIVGLLVVSLVAYWFLAGRTPTVKAEEIKSPPPPGGQFPSPHNIPAPQE